MTLNEIAHAIDMQILRMQRVRAIVMTLLSAEIMPTTEALELKPEKLPLLDSLSPDVTQSSAPVLKPRLRPSRELPPRMARKLHRPHAKGMELRATALGGAVPQGPVVVSAADVVRSRNVSETLPPRPSLSAPSLPGHSLEDLVRQLTERSGASLSNRSNNGSSH